MRKLKTEADDLFAINPTLVVARGHGQGQQGPDAEAGGFDGVSYWARGGIGHMITAPRSTGPGRPEAGDGRRTLVYTCRTGDERWLGLTMLDEDRYWAPPAEPSG
jgi:crotonobetainyl-CoA:carnitine CoA-transferase CaiB-like acyl-CoA transferase